MERDPRKDPRVGDVLERLGTRYTVTLADDCGVEYRWHDDDAEGSGALYLTSWRRELEGATVLRVAP
jgi:hypothetical protein